MGRICWPFELSLLLFLVKMYFITLVIKDLIKANSYVSVAWAEPFNLERFTQIKRAFCGMLPLIPLGLFITASVVKTDWCTSWRPLTQCFEQPSPRVNKAFTPEGLGLHDSAAAAPASTSDAAYVCFSSPRSSEVWQWTAPFLSRACGRPEDASIPLHFKESESRIIAKDTAPSCGLIIATLPWPLSRLEFSPWWGYLYPFPELHPKWTAQSESHKWNSETLKALCGLLGRMTCGRCAASRLCMDTHRHTTVHTNTPLWACVESSEKCGHHQHSQGSVSCCMEPTALFCKQISIISNNSTLQVWLVHSIALLFPEGTAKYPDKSSCEQQPGWGARRKYWLKLTVSSFPRWRQDWLHDSSGCKS